MSIAARHMCNLSGPRDPGLLSYKCIKVSYNNNSSWMQFLLERKEVILGWMFWQVHKQYHNPQNSIVTYLAMLSKWSALPLRGLMASKRRSIGNTTKDEPVSRIASINWSALSSVYSTMCRHRRDTWSRWRLPVQNQHLWISTWAVMSNVTHFTVQKCLEYCKTSFIREDFIFA